MNTTKANTAGLPALLTALLTAMVLAISVACSLADEKVSLSGDAKCGKCQLKDGSAECHSVIQAEKDGKMVTYYLVDNDASKELHGKLCKQSKKVKATGMVKETDGKMYLTASKIQME